MTSRRSRALARMVLVALGVALVLAFGAAPASAAPAEPTKSLTEVRAALEASGTLTGYFKTVLQGAEIKTITCEVVAVTGAPTDVSNPDVDLIIFESDDAEIQRIGGIAAGMSGSPLFVDIDGSPYLVGAVAYGDIFTLGGMGAATPIEAMEAVEALTEVAAPLSKSIATSTGMKNSVAISSDLLKGYSSSAAGMLTLKPLAPLYIGGVSPNSSSYRTYKKLAEERGFDVVPLAAPGLGTGNESYETTLEGGAACAVLAARGDLWVGALGTVTYANNGNVMMFGHPMTGEGDTGLYMHNGWIDTTWRTSYFPYKWGVPGKMRGTATQDRGAGVLGVIDEGPKEVIVGARAYRSDPGKEKVATSTVGLPDVIANSTSDNWYGITPFAASMAASELFTTWPAGGSAVASTTVVVTDGTNDYTITRRNVFDDAWDIPYLVASDVDFIVGNVLSVRGAGYYPNVAVKSITTESTLTASRASARIVDVSTPNGFKRGDNLVRISLLARGVLETQTIDVTLTVPANAPLDGELQVYSAGGGGGFFYDEEMMEEFIYEDYSWDEDRRTLAQAIEDINEAPTNDMITVAYGSMETEEMVAEASVPTDWYVTGYTAKQAVRMFAYVMPRSTVAGGRVDVEGWLEGATGGTINIYGLAAGDTVESLLATAAIAGPDPEEETEGGDFYAYVGPLWKNTVLRIEYTGDADTLAVQTSRSVAVAARVSLAANRRVVTSGASVTLTANVRPTDFGGKVYFERYIAGYGWRRISSYLSAPTGTATFTFRPPAGTVRVRARTLGSATNANGTSGTVSLSVR